MRQGDVGDGGVEHLHKGGERDRHGDDPWIDARPTGLVNVMCAGEFRSGKFYRCRCHRLILQILWGWGGIQFLGRKDDGAIFGRSILWDKALKKDGVPG